MKYSEKNMIFVDELLLITIPKQRKRHVRRFSVYGENQKDFNRSKNICLTIGLFRVNAEQFYFILFYRRSKEITAKNLPVPYSSFGSVLGRRKRTFFESFLTCIRPSTSGRIEYITDEAASNANGRKMATCRTARCRENVLMG